MYMCMIHDVFLLLQTSKLFRWLNIEASQHDFLIKDRLCSLISTGLHYNITTLSIHVSIKDTYMMTFQNIFFLYLFPVHHVLDTPNCKEKCAQATIIFLSMFCTLYLTSNRMTFHTTLRLMAPPIISKRFFKYLTCLRNSLRCVLTPAMIEQITNVCY